MTPFLIENQLFQKDYTILILVFVLGAIAGSFSHAFADGIIHGRKILRRSECNYCKKTILWAHLIPIFSYISLKGKCSHCNKKIHFEILIFEIYFAFLYVLYFLYLDVWYFLQFALILIFLAVIFETDRKKLFFDQKCLIMILIISIGFNTWPYIDYKVFLDKFFLFSFGWLLIFIISYLYFLFKGIQGFGSGDKWLLGIISTMFTYQDVIYIFLSSCIIGSVIGIITLIYNKSITNLKLPFGSFICFVSTIYPIL